MHWLQDFYGVSGSESRRKRGSLLEDRLGAFGSSALKMKTCPQFGLEFRV